MIKNLWEYFIIFIIILIFVLFFLVAIPTGMVERNESDIIELKIENKFLRNEMEKNRSYIRELKKQNKDFKNHHH